MTPEQIDEALRQFEDSLAGLPTADIRRLVRIFQIMAAGTLDLEGVRDMMRRLGVYYGDLDRAKRTPQPVYNMHMGFLIGVCLLLCDRLEQLPHVTREQ